MKIREMAARFKAKTGGDFGIDRIDAADALASSRELANKIISAITSAPMLSANRLVIIEDILSNKSVAEEVLKNLDSVPKETVVIFYERKVDARSKLFKKLLDKARSHKFTELSEAKLIAWLGGIARERGGQLDTKSAQFLVSRIGTDQWRLFNELTKLISYNSTVTTKTIEQLTEPVFEQTVFNLVDAVSAGDSKKALVLYSRLRAAKTEPVLIIGALGWQFKNILIAKAAKEAQKSRQEVLADFDISPYGLNHAAAIAAKLSLSQIKSLHSLLAEADYRLKSSGMDKDVLMEHLLASMAEEILVESH